MSKLDSKKANKLRDELNSSIKSLGGESSLDLSVLLSLNNSYDKQSSTNSNKIAADSKSRYHNKLAKTNSSVNFSNNKSQTVNTEINLIGENVASAVEILDKYLDNCTMAHLHQVRVVHGKGTGKLREGIHQYLKKSKYVDSYNIAGFGEGDYGVTIVNLRT